MGRGPTLFKSRFLNFLFAGESHDLLGKNKHAFYQVNRRVRHKSYCIYLCICSCVENYTEETERPRQRSTKGYLLRDLLERVMEKGTTLFKSRFLNFLFAGESHSLLGKSKHAFYQVKERVRHKSYYIYHAVVWKIIQRRQRDFAKEVRRVKQKEESSLRDLLERVTWRGSNTVQVRFLKLFVHSWLRFSKFLLAEGPNFIFLSTPGHNFFIFPSHGH